MLPTPTASVGFTGNLSHDRYTRRPRPLDQQLSGYGDTRALKLYSFDLPQGAWVTGDEAYIDYGGEDALKAAGIQLLPLRKKKPKRPAWSQ